MAKTLQIRCTFRPHHNALAKVTVQLTGAFNRAADRLQLDKELQAKHGRFWSVAGSRYQAEVLTV